MVVLVVDIGGSHVKMCVSGTAETRRFASGLQLTPNALVARVNEATRDWCYDVITRVLGDALGADYVLLGGGNAGAVEPLPPGARRGGNEDACTGGFRLWEEVVEPHDRQPPAVWRVVR